LIRDDRGGIARVGVGVAVAIWLSVVILQPRLFGRPELLAPIAVTVLLIALACAVGIVVGSRSGLAWVVLLAIGLVGIGLRLMLVGRVDSDVLVVTQAAVGEWLSGGVPYGIGYAVTTPPGAPFPYGPVALVWYALASSATQEFELAIGCFVLAVLVLRGRPIGAAAYALMPLVFAATVDGSNDTSAGLFLLVALVGLSISRFGGGILLALAVGFKLFAAAWLLPAVFIGGWSVLGGFALGSAVAWGPALLAWGLRPIVASMGRALEVHGRPSYSLAAAVEALTGRPVAPEAFRLLGPIAGALTAAVVFAVARVRRVDTTLAGLAIFIVTIYSGYWASQTYLVMAAPVLCWELDRWLGTSRWTVRWPLSPLRRLAERLGALRVGPVVEA
jgi:hypothetical protein